MSSRLCRRALDAFIALVNTHDAACSCSSRTDLGDERRALRALTASRSAGPQRPRISRSRERLLPPIRESTPQSSIRISDGPDPSPHRPDRCCQFASRSCFFPRASDALDVKRSAWRGVALEASHPPLSTRTIRRPGGRAEDAIVEETFPIEHRNLGSEH